MDRSEGEKPRTIRGSVSSLSRREAARCEQVKHDNANNLKKVYISPKVLLDKTFGVGYNISRVQRQQVEFAP